MKKNLFLVTAIFIASLLAGCQDEIVQEYKSPGEKIGEQIMELAKQNSITHVKLWNTPYWKSTYTFKINGDIMAVYVENNSIEYYNLNYVQNFHISGKYIAVFWLANPRYP